MKRLHSILELILFFLFGYILFIITFLITRVIFYKMVFGVIIVISAAFKEYNSILFMIYSILFFIFLMWTYLYNIYCIKKLNKLIK